MLAALQPYLPYLLPMILLGLNEIIAHSPSIQSNSLVSLIISAVINGLKSMIGNNPVPKQ